LGLICYLLVMLSESWMQLPNYHQKYLM